MMTLITINRVYYLIGFVVMLLVVMTLRDRANPKRYTTALFWFLFGGIFLFGDLMVQELGKSPGVSHYWRRRYRDCAAGRFRAGREGAL